MLKENQYKLLPITVRDAEVLALIHAECFIGQQIWSQETFKDFFTSNTNWGRVSGWMAIQGEQECGFILVRKIVQECEILTFAVRPDFQRKGIGRLLLRHLLDEMDIPIFLEVATDNFAAIKLYESEGFEVLTIRRSYYESEPGRPRKDAYLMRYRPAVG
ncbi:MAG: ribosomal protein S18-alanine N-acetyltransferase [Alphaproteobacteria bacterium]|nr:ribosomal protein S18-alanine N-acetyltransferase [Alphaproteobacteria bacterium]